MVVLAMPLVTGPLLRPAGAWIPGRRVMTVPWCRCMSRRVGGSPFGTFSAGAAPGRLRSFAVPALAEAVPLLRGAALGRLHRVQLRFVVLEGPEHLGAFLDLDARGGGVPCVATAVGALQREVRVRVTVGMPVHVACLRHTSLARPRSRSPHNAGGGRPRGGSACGRRPRGFCVEAEGKRPRLRSDPVSLLGCELQPRRELLEGAEVGPAVLLPVQPLKQLELLWRASQHAVELLPARHAVVGLGAPLRILQ
mmetsp:Transcript_3068/g.7212  ORF Transcript_3068/g.7212 Transcript_3068/m.7212 type:complete len:252 (+) Transcript_3068:387-1142(+)